MALVNQTLKLEITPGGVPPKLHVTEYDENMQVVAQLFQRGQYYEIPSGTTAKVEGTLAGHPFSADATVDGSNVTFELTKSMTAYAGRAWTKIKLTKDGKPVSTCGFWLECDRAGVEAGDVIGAPGFEEQIAAKLAEKLPDKLPNPNALTFTGAVTGSYDGSEALTVEIPSGGSSVPKPLTYDYMPEGYPKKAMGTVTLIEEQELAFGSGDGGYIGFLTTHALDIVEGQTYTVNWDGTEYECVGFVFGNEFGLGNRSLMGLGDDTGEPFLVSYGYSDDANAVVDMFFTLDTSATHTVGVKTAAETVTPMAEEFIPTTAKLPNPNPLTFTGAVTGSYDGSEALTVEIPSGGGIETVEAQLVDIPSKLSQFENDAGYLTLDTLPKYDGSVT